MQYHSSVDCMVTLNLKTVHKQSQHRQTGIQLQKKEKKNNTCIHFLVKNTKVTHTVSFPTAIVLHCITL